MTREKKIDENDEFRVMRESIVTLTSTLDLDEVLEYIVTDMRRVVPHDSALIMLVDNGHASIVQSDGFLGREVQSWLLNQRLSISETAELRQMEQTGKSLVVSTIPSEWYAERPRSMAALQSYVSTPICLKGKAIGFLYLFSKRARSFMEIHGERLLAFAEYAAIGIQNAQLYEKAQALAALEERQRLARELHDAVTQTLFSASIIAESLPRLWERKPEKVSTLLEQMHVLIRGASAEMRILLMELRPNSLFESQIDDLLKQLTRAIMGRTRIDVTFTAEGQQPVPPRLYHALYYIAQEALMNVAKHSHATQTMIVLRHEPGHIELMISDNGRGFDPEHIRREALGLNVMRERAEAVGAAFEIHSEVGQGTQVRMNWTEQDGKEPL
ncbi:MAG TPA: GAF domain-containing sensor histidine kinase [Aggregatilineaceae bacterium]|nr:GAF domain-containing sensor histidine kinase [Aggregatilineaceae bacterium]